MARGTKRKIEIKKLETKEQRAVPSPRRRQTLFNKAAVLCLLSGEHIAVLVNSPAGKSNVADSFPRNSSDSEIADFYLNGKLPPKRNLQSKLGFWWTDPALYHSCEDLSELNIIEDRMKRAKKDLMAFLEKEENPRICSLDESCLQVVSSDHRKPSSAVYEYCGGSSSQSSVYDSDQNPNSSYGGDSSSDHSRYLVNNDLGCFNCLWETEKENNQTMSVPQATQPIINADGGYEDQSFWDDLCNEDAVNNGLCLDNTNEEDDEELLNDEEIGGI